MYDLPKEPKAPKKHQICKHCENYDQSMMYCEVFECEMDEDEKKCGDFFYRAPSEN